MSNGRNSARHAAVRRVLIHHGLTKVGDCVVEADLIACLATPDAPSAEVVPRDLARWESVLNECLKDCVRGVTSDRTRASMRGLINEFRALATSAPIAAEVVPSAVALKRLEKHVRRAGDCPDDSKVVLWSAINRLATPAPEVPADRAALAKNLRRLADIGSDCGRLVSTDGEAWVGMHAAADALATPAPAAVTVLMSESLERRQQAIDGVRAALREFGHDAEGTVTDLAAKVRAALAPPKGEPFAWLVCSVNSDGTLSLEYAAPWREAAHEHIGDAIEGGIDGAASWVVRPACITQPRET